MVLTCCAEFRGLLKRNANNVDVYTANFEDESGIPFSLYLGTDTKGCVGLKKGDVVSLKLDFVETKDNKFLRLLDVGV